MTKVNSDVGIVGRHISQIDSASEGLTGGGSVNLDSSTTVSGNSKVREMVTTIGSESSKFNSALKISTNTLKNIAQDFEAVDKAGSSIFGK